jgi:hypothetical protein
MFLKVSKKIRSTNNKGVKKTIVENHSANFALKLAKSPVENRHNYRESV